MPDSNTDGNAYGDSYANFYAYSYSYGYGYVHAYGYRDCHGYVYADAYSDGDRSETDANAQTAPNNTAAETIVRSGKWNSSCGNSRVTLASSPSEVDWLLPDFRAFCRGSRAGCNPL